MGVLDVYNLAMYPKQTWSRGLYIIKHDPSHEHPYSTLNSWFTWLITSNSKANTYKVRILMLMNQELIIYVNMFDPWNALDPTFTGQSNQHADTSLW